MDKRWIFLAGLSLCLVGCDRGSKAELQQYIQTVKSRKPHAIEPIPEFKKAEVFSYEADNERNPFAPFVDLRGNNLAQGPDQNRPKEPLEAFPLDALKMVGTVTVKEELWALITAPDGKIYRARRGNFLGQNYGKIKKIASDGIHLVEMVNVSGAWERKPAKLSMGSVE